MPIETKTDNNGDEYVPVPVAKVYPDRTLCSDIFLHIDNKFICYRAQNDILPAHSYDHLIAKNLKEFYIKMTDLQSFMNWLKATKDQVVDEIVEKVGEEHREIVEKREEIREQIFETFAGEDLNSDKVDILKNQVEELISDIQEQKVPKAVLAKLMSLNQGVADHSLNVATFSMFIAMVLGYGNKQILEDLYMGALFHDYAKAKIPQEVLDNEKNQKYAQAIQDHPEKSAKVLKKFDNISVAVFQIVMQHHEQFNGSGYPKGLSGDDISSLSRIVSIANIFDNTLTANIKKPEKERFRTAIKVIQYDSGKQFDPEIVRTIIDPLKLAYGDYYKE